MNHYFRACEEMRGSTYQKEPLVCPKPRRVGVLSNVHLRWHFNEQPERSDSKAETELLDILFKKQSNEKDFSHEEEASFPSYFCGSPPVRAANPLVHDDRFRDEKQHAAIPSSSSSSPSPSGLSSPSRKGGCVRMSFGLKPAVRVEGFDCPNRDCQNSSIPVVA